MLLLGKAVFSGTRSATACMHGLAVHLSCIWEFPHKTQSPKGYHMNAGTCVMSVHYLHIIAFLQGIKLKYLYQSRFTSIRGQFTHFQGYLLIIYMKLWKKSTHKITLRE